MSENRPEWVRCIEQTHNDKIGQSWCGRRLEQSESDRNFFDIEHAAYNGLAEGRLVACTACVDAAMAALRTGAPDPTKVPQPPTQ